VALRAFFETGALDKPERLIFAHFLQLPTPGLISGGDGPKYSMERGFSVEPCGIDYGAQSGFGVGGPFGARAVCDFALDDAGPERSLADVALRKRNQALLTMLYFLTDRLGRDCAPV
jgi:hypothetical protein